METQSKAPNKIPKKLRDVRRETACSFKAACELLQRGTRDYNALDLDGPLVLDREAMDYLKLLPKAFDKNWWTQTLSFCNCKVDNILVAEAFKAGITKDRITSIKFSTINEVSSQSLLETMCEGLKQRSTPFELDLHRCCAELAKPVLEASHLKCFSFSASSIDFSTIKRPLKNFFLKSNLYYIFLGEVEGLKESSFIQLGRCLLPNLATLTLGSNVPTSAMKCLIGHLKMILDSGRSNLFEYLDLGKNLVGSKLSFACFSLLRSDLIGEFRLRMKKDISRAAVKSVSSIVTKTNNLEQLHTRYIFSSGTKFNNFNLQEKRTYFFHPFEVNPVKKTRRD